MTQSDLEPTKINTNLMVYSAQSNIHRLMAFLLVMCIALPSFAADRPKIGLALSGGGARGGAHIGVIRELERQRIPIDYISGTSMGAILGAMYASGYSTDEMEAVLKDTDWDNIFDDDPPRKHTTIRDKFDERVFQLDTEIGLQEGKLSLPSGLVQGQKFQLLLDKLFLPVTEINDFSQLPIPFRAVASDIEDGTAVVLGSGELSRAVRASISVPAAFATVEIDGRILVDGGISNNLPLDVVREMGADVVIAVDIGTPFQEADQLRSAVTIAAQLSALLVRRTTVEQIATLKEGDVLLTPDIGKFSSTNFDDSYSIIPQGVEAAREQGSVLEKLSLSDGDYQAHVASRPIIKFNNPTVAFIRIDSDTNLSEDYILDRIRQKTGEPLNLSQLEEDISVVYGLEVFQTVDYKIVEEGGETGLLIRAKSKPWGPNYLQLGLSFSSNVESSDELGLNLGYSIRPFNAWNAELRGVLSFGNEPGIYGEYNQPLGTDSPYFFNGVFSYVNRRFNLFEDQTKISEIRSKEVRLTAALGRQSSHSSDIRLGLNRFYSDNEIEVGLPDETISDVNGSEAFVRYRFDNLDNLFFPKRGIAGFIEWLESQTALGADDEYEQALFDLISTRTYGKHTFNLGARYFTTYEGDVTVQSRFRLGGLFELPGYGTNELSGQHLYLLRTAYRRPFQKLFGTSPELGFTLQYGQVFEDEDDISLSDGITAGGLWLGWDTRFGPIYIGGGSADSNNTSIYIIVGNFF
ncbi:MAG: patatin-like phospholipase family protein [bacterium]